MPGAVKPTFGLCLTILRPQVFLHRHLCTTQNGSRFTIPVYIQAAWLTAYLRIAKGHQINNHDVLQKDHSGEEHVNEKLSAAGAQTLIVQPHLDEILCLTGLAEV